MSMGCKPINIVWLKRDLRLHDHAPLYQAQREFLEKSTPFIVLYVFEPLVENYYDYDLRHRDFICESLSDLSSQIPLSICSGDLFDIFEEIQEKYQIQSVFSHQETGLDHTYNRDKDFALYCNRLHIIWKEFQQNGVLRGRVDRSGWDSAWLRYMKSEQIPPVVTSDGVINYQSLRYSHSLKLANINGQQPRLKQRGGEIAAWKELNHFLQERIEGYWGSISYPEKSRYFCSRLSAYISWGNLSIRQIHQACSDCRAKVKNKRSIDQFKSRLKWHCHFIQKLEMQTSMEKKNLNRAYDGIRQKKNKKYIKAWEQGMTGYPLIDAAMRCVEQTGYLNFRLRACIVSFLTHHLWQPWQVGAKHLARMFLDYEPGIHFSQFQMQAGTTGINTIRIYNPVKQSLEKDKDAVFIKKWVPELSNLPVNLIHEPWKMTAMDEMMYSVTIGKDYPKRIIDHEKASSAARDKLWELKKSQESKVFSKDILKKHVRKSRPRRR